eukprot:6458109-Amphidinium_carterae.1
MSTFGSIIISLLCSSIEQDNPNLHPDLKKELRRQCLSSFERRRGCLSWFHAVSPAQSSSKRKDMMSSKVAI